MTIGETRFARVALQPDEVSSLPVFQAKPEALEITFLRKKSLVNSGPLYTLFTLIQRCSGYGSGRSGHRIDRNPDAELAGPA
jgi:hypothetical protein